MRPFSRRPTARFRDVIPRGMLLATDSIADSTSGESRPLRFIRVTSGAGGSSRDLAVIAEEYDASSTISTALSRTGSGFTSNTSDTDLSSLTQRMRISSSKDVLEDSSSASSEVSQGSLRPNGMRVEIISGDIKNASDPPGRSPDDDHMIFNFDDQEVDTTNESNTALVRRNYLDGRVEEQDEWFDQQGAKLHRLRLRNFATRGLVDEKRRELAISRSKVSVADEAFMRLLREQPRMADGRDGQILFEYFQRLRDARDVYGVLDEAFASLEDRMSREDFEVWELEKHLLRPTSSPRLGQDDDWYSISQKSSRDDLKQAIGDMIIDDEVDAKGDPLYNRYMSRLGDADHVREAYTDILIERDHLQESQELRRRVGLELSPEDLDTLLSFSVEEDKIIAELRDIEDDIDQLRGACIHAGLLPTDEPEIQAAGEATIHLPEEDDSTLETEDEYVDITQVDHPQSEYSRFRLLLDEPGNIDDENESKSIISGFRLGDKGDQIARWLLHKLRSSYGEVQLFARYSNDELSKYLSIETMMNVTEQENQHWQEEALGFWFVDGANLPASAYEADPINATENPTDAATDSATATATTLAIPVELFAISPTSVVLPHSKTPSPALIALPYSRTPSPALITLPYSRTPSPALIALPRSQLSSPLSSPLSSSPPSPLPSPLLPLPSSLVPPSRIIPGPISPSKSLQREQSLPAVLQFPRVKPPPQEVKLPASIEIEPDAHARARTVLEMDPNPTEAGHWDRPAENESTDLVTLHRVDIVVRSGMKAQRNGRFEALNLGLILGLKKRKTLAGRRRAMSL